MTVVILPGPDPVHEHELDGEFDSIREPPLRLTLALLLAVDRDHAFADLDVHVLLAGARNLHAERVLAVVFGEVE
jgi:hypothetical protein